MYSESGPPSNLNQIVNQALYGIWNHHRVLQNFSGRQACREQARLEVPTALFRSLASLILNFLDFSFGLVALLSRRSR